MKVFCSLGLLVVGLALCPPAEGAEPGCRWWQWPWCPLHQPCPCCPDDYCPKKQPSVPCPVPCRGPDDYSSKALPAACPLKWFGADDYCPKACPISPWPGFPPWYTCGPAEACDRSRYDCLKVNP